jgi:LPXTG-motif cell wall-anchored protein
MSRCRALVVVLSLALMLPSAAFAQGAGDEQYQDPFGDEEAQTQPAETRAAQDDGDDGLSDAPPVDDGDGQQAPPADDPPADDEPTQRPERESGLPNTGHDPRVLAFFGLLFLLVGVGLRLRTLDPDAY